MAKDSSFEIVSTVDMQEVDNAFQQTSRELAQRYDLKATGAAIELSKAEGTLAVTAPSEFVASQVVDVLNGRLARRHVDLKAVRWDKPQPASGSAVRMAGHVVQGIDQETAKRIARDVRDQGTKAKVTVEGDKLRVVSASKDTLQQIIAFLRNQDYGQPLQYVNYR